MKVSNNIFKFGLSPNAMKVYIYLTCCQNCLGMATVRARTIAAACDISSLATVHTVIHELEAKNLVVKFQRRDAAGDYIANGYDITQLGGKWFWVPGIMNILKLPKSSFVTFLYLRKCARPRTGNAFPSFNRMASDLHTCRNTIIAAINDLIGRLLILKAKIRPGKHNLYKVYACAPIGTQAQKNSAVCSPRYFSTNVNSNIYNFCTTIIQASKRFVKHLGTSLSVFIDRVVQKLYTSI